MPVSTTYNTYRPDGTTELNGSFVYWTSPAYNSSARAVSSTEPNTPSMVYSPTVPAKAGATKQVTPAPWVPYTRAGCSVADYATANMVLQNTNLDIPTVFGQDSAEAAENAADTGYKDKTVAKYVGEAIHCAKSDTACNSAQRAVNDVLPTEPGGCDGYKALFGHKYISPLLTGGKANVSRNGYPVSDANGCRRSIRCAPRATPSSPRVTTTSTPRPRTARRPPTRRPTASRSTPSRPGTMATTRPTSTIPGPASSDRA
ncbi:hypothetical protein ACWEQ7_05625 [Streptomyces sp. NPDC004069]